MPGLTHKFRYRLRGSLSLWLCLKVLAVLSLVFTTAEAGARQLQPFLAEYEAVYRGLPVRATGIRELVRLDDGSYRFTSTAKAFFAGVSEETVFEVAGSGIRPLSYRYERTGIGRNRSEFARFDWVARQVTHSEGVSSLPAGSQDKLAYQLQLREDLAAHSPAGDAPPVFDYLVVDEEKQKLYRFRVTGEESLDTPLGTLVTLRIERDRDDPDRHTTFWLAPSLDYLLVRLVQQDGERGFELNLKAYSGSPAE